MKLVLDIDVVVAAMRSPAGASAELLRLAVAGRVRLAASVALALEYEAICSDPKHWMEAALTRDEVQIFIDAVIALMEPVAIHYRWRPQLKDPADEMVLEAAINGGAEAIVTFNRRDYGRAPERFGIDVWLPGEALEEWRKRRK